jgi:hypothetical protein
MLRHTCLLQLAWIDMLHTAPLLSCCTALRPHAC